MLGTSCDRRRVRLQTPRPQVTQSISAHACFTLDVPHVASLCESVNRPRVVVLRTPHKGGSATRDGWVETGDRVAIKRFR